jgi:hypothetical protein
LISQDVNDTRAYFRQPRVWDDLRHVYEPYLAAVPDDLHARSNYCADACIASDWATAQKQFEVLGENAVLDKFGSVQNLKGYREQARKAAEKDKTGP